MQGDFPELPDHFEHAVIPTDRTSTCDVRIETDMPSFTHRQALASVAAIGLMLWSSVGQAADPRGQFSIRGPGSQSCANYLAAASKPDDYARYGSWLLGYVSARNRAEPNTYDVIPTEPGTDFPNIVAVICKSNVQVTVEQAANSAIAVIGPMRQTAASPMIDVQVDGKTVAIHQESLRRLQQGLIAKNAYKGSADGISSARFIAALKDFQRKEGIAVTGLPDIDTFIRAIIKR
jgi:hypothetical protein